eukprot:m.226776 g.226776  ORF g.226776 m.226776 type:complete len:152 (-) comp33501_c7_seq3:233-688(-)
MVSATSQTYVLTRKYIGDKDNFELCGQTGDIFHDVDVLADQQWVRAKDADGNRGILPAHLLKRVSDGNDSTTQVAITDFIGDASNYECDFKKGEVASNMRLCGDAAWVHVKNATTGCAGVVPTSVFKHETHKALQFHHEDSTTNPIFISAQ